MSLSPPVSDKRGSFFSAVAAEESELPPSYEHPAHDPIRSIRPEDREPIYQLLVETDVFTAEEVKIAMELVDIVLNDPAQQDYIIRAYDSGSVLGYYCVGPTPATQSTFDLYWIAVKPSAHRHGIGAALNSHAEALIHSKGGRLVIAETSSQAKYEKTRRFYLKQGYSQMACIRDYYKVGDDLVIYGKYLI